MVRESIKETVEVPQGVSIEINGYTVKMKKGGLENSRTFNVSGITIKKLDNRIEIEAIPATKKMNSLLRTTVGHLQNMANGLEKEFEYKLTVVFSHFPMGVAVKGGFVEVNNFTGEKNVRKARVFPGVKVEIKGKEIFVRGHDLEATGQTAANIENATHLTGKDRRVFQDGIYIVSKPK